MDANTTAMTASKFGLVVLVLRRVVRHVTRRKALLAALLGCIAAIVATVIGPSTEVGQVMLVALGIFASVVVLPDAPHRLWNVTTLDLAETVPRNHLLEATRSIAKAIYIQSGRESSFGILPEHLVDSIWDNQLNNFVGLLRDPSRVVLDMNYHVRITPSTDNVNPHRVRTTIDTRRHLPHLSPSIDGFKTRRIWFSYCSNMSVLSEEFAAHADGCLARELIERGDSEQPEAWFERVSGYEVGLRIDGQEVQVVKTDRVVAKTERGERPDGCIYRIWFPAGEIGTKFTSTELTARFCINRNTSHFPVKFAAYSIVGTTSITLEVEGSNIELDYDEYLAPVDRNIDIKQGLYDSSTECTVRTRGTTVLPMGAGAVFLWQTRLPSGS